MCIRDRFEEWARELVGFGMSQHDAELLCNKAERFVARSSDVEQAIRKSERELTSDQSTFSKAQLVEKTANHLVASGMAFNDVRQAVDNEIKQGRVVSLGNERLQPMLSSQATLEMEDKLSRQIRNASQNQSFTVSEKNIAAAIKKTESELGISFDEDYRAAISYLAAGTTKDKSVGANRVLIGDAGSGKTTLLGTVRTALENEGYRVVGAALAGKAADVLEIKAGIQSATIDKWIHELKRSSSLSKTKHSLNMMYRVASKKQTWSLDEFRLDSKTVLVIDEAAMTDTPKLFKLYEQAQKAGSMVIWSGDDKQCQAIGHGGAFSLASRVSDSYRISKNFRQKSKADQQLASLMAEGKSDLVLKKLVDDEKLKVAATKSKAIEALVSDWSKEGVLAPEENQIFVSVHEDRMAINELCQQERMRAHKRKLRIGVTNHEGQQLFKGDRIAFGENMILRNQHQSLVKYLGNSIKQTFSGAPGGEQRVRNGQFATVLSVNPIKKTLRVKMDDGRLLNVPAEVRDESKKNIFGQYHTDLLGRNRTRKAEISLGYASTTHAGQGSEFQNTFLLAGGRMQDRELSYVQLTRHTDQVNLYTTQDEAGNELLLRSLYNKAIAEDNQARADALAEEIKKAAEKRGDGLLAKRMANSNTKEFALESVYPTHQSHEIGR